MIAIDDKLVSNDLVEKDFVCNLNACKGACCVEGENGAPLELDEIEILEEDYERIKPYLTEAGIRAIDKQGTHEFPREGRYL